MYLAFYSTTFYLEDFHSLAMEAAREEAVLSNFMLYNNNINFVISGHKKVAQYGNTSL